MLKGIPNILSPELLKVLMEMGHGDTIVIADGNFPAHSMGPQVIRLDGHGVPEILKAILQVMPLDKYVDAATALMEVTPQDKGMVPEIWSTYKQLIDTADGNQNIEHIERFKFYDESKKAYAIVATGEAAIYANVILKKGVVFN
ncbi:L-fucose mutarotase [Candidatus Epulonipiscium viviparus]|uniref:L-fucose mutarotase n=1 Tax=Candidatus Epulonipiscium viviparus TaxID=420336 RepID=UPI002738048F|nr:L-fucose mutarotase [Candidatus Epulopiscium viviparus]